MVELVSTPSSSSIPDGATSLNGDQLAELIQLQLADETFVIVTLDCRSGGNNSTVNGAQKIRLPTVLMRRLQSGSLSPTSLSPLLSDAAKVQCVVVIPGVSITERDIASKICQTLLKNQFRVAVLQDDPSSLATVHPEIVHGTETDCAVGLNFNLFKEINNSEYKSRQVDFPAPIFHDVYLGNDETAKDKALLQRLGINYVINVTSDLPNYFEKEPEFNYLRIPVDDSYAHNLAKYFPDAIAFIEKARAEKTAVLVHCWAGISRSVTVCLAWLMYARQSTLDEAFDLLLKQNGSIAPNFHFMESLLNWERKIRHDEDSGNGSSIPSSSVSTTSSTCSSA